jgi:hypothetical protein
MSLLLVITEKYLKNRIKTNPYGEQIKVLLGFVSAVNPALLRDGLRQSSF